MNDVCALHKLTILQRRYPNIIYFLTNYNDSLPPHEHRDLFEHDVNHATLRTTFLLRVFKVPTNAFLCYNVLLVGCH